MTQLRTLAASLIIGSSLAACTSGDRAAGSADTGGTLIVNVGADAQTLFPPLVADESSKALTDLLFDHLAEISDSLNTVGDGGFAPRLASRWDWAHDSMSIAFHLDPRARWHDGQPVRARDVRFTFTLAMDTVLRSPLAAVLANVDSVSVKDSLTAVVWFKRHTPEEFYDIAYQLAILPEHVYGAIPIAQLPTSDVLRHPIGSGRFRFASWSPGARVELVADTANYRGRAKLDRVVWSIGGDPATNAAQLLAGDADFYQAFPLTDEVKLDSSRVARPIPYTQLGFSCMVMNSRDPKAKTHPHPIFGDVKVRRALSMAMDRDGMLHNVFGQFGRTAYGPFPRLLPSADTTLRLLPYDVTAAKALLDSAGWRERSPGGIREKNGRPLRFSLIYPLSSAFRTAYAKLIAGALAQVGAQVDLLPREGKVFNGQQQGGDFDASMQSLVLDPSVGGEKQVWSTSGIGETGLNVGAYSNRSVDALLDSATTTFDHATMRRYASRAFQQIIDDAPAVWLYDVGTVAAVNRRIVTIPLRADGWWAHLADWSVSPGQQIDRDRVGLAATKH